MKQVILLLLWIIPTLLKAQFNENTLEPIQWNGDMEAFEIIGGNVLRSKTITTTYLSAENSLAYNSVWEFGIQLDFNPSSENQLRLYLISDKDTLKNPLNGYFIQIGEPGDTDRYHLFKQNGEHLTLLISSPTKSRVNTLQVKSRVKVTRDSLGKWSLYTAHYEEDFVFDGSKVDNEFRISTHFGIHCRFTSGNSNKFQFDYFKIDTLGKEHQIDTPEIEPPLQKLKPSLIDELLFIDTFENNHSLWDGEINKFVVDKKLLLNNEKSKSPSFLKINNKEVRNRLWEAGIEVNGLLTTQNNIRLYLVATQDSLPGNQQGYYLQIDGTNGNHTYKLYRQNNSSRSILWQSQPFPTQDNKFKARVRVICTIDGEWKIYSDEYNAGNFSLLHDKNGISSVIDLSHNTSLYAGWMTRFSSTRVQDYALHYFLIKELENIPPTTKKNLPYIVSSIVLDSISIGLNFNKELDNQSAINVENYWLHPNYGMPIKSVTEGSMVIISFADPLLSNEYELSVKHIADTSGNIVTDTLISFNYKASETVEPESPWQKLQPDAFEEFLIFDSFKNGLSLWSGETEKFQIENQLLINTDTAKSPSFLHFPNTEIRNRLWEVGLEVNGLLTTHNNVRLYLIATNDSLPGNQKGYYLQIDGANGNHTYKLYRQNNSSRSILWQSQPFPTQDNKFKARVRVICTIDGEWKIYSDEYDQGEFTLLSDKNGISSILDLSHSTSLYSGWMTKFSSTRVQNYSLHYFLIKELENLTTPIEKEPTYMAKPYDVIINEIMADPKNAIGLPEIEYVELKNLSGEEINLKGWTYSSINRTHQFVGGSIPPYSYLILYKESDSLVVKDMGNSLGLSTWLPLVNTGTTLSLKNEKGLIIDEVEYKTAWYGDTKKSKGGWSLERIDSYLRCEDDTNWRASSDPSGGSPGKENSINETKHNRSMAIVNLEFTNLNRLSVFFNKNIEPSTALKTTFMINNGMGSPDSVDIINSKQIILFYSNRFIKGNHYKLTIEDLADCVGNKTNLTRETFLAEGIDPKDILINEVLADPFKDGVEFIEIYNNSQKTLNLNTLYLGTINEADGSINSKVISKEPHFIPPASYKLLSSNSNTVAHQYINSRVENFIEMSSFPQLRNSHGTIVLINEEKEIDRFNYNEDMHDILITNKKGVSLERVHFNRPTNEPRNFKSAASTVGFATPGYTNSQFHEENQQKSQVSLHSKTFSPDSDGYEDLLEINYSFQEEDVMSNIEIYNDRGVLIKTLHKNHRLSKNGTLYWDGLMDNNQPANMGIYIIVMEFYNSKGMRKIMRESCVLARKF
jgi:hypothetical protein